MQSYEKFCTGLQSYEKWCKSLLGGSTGQSWKSIANVVEENFTKIYKVVPSGLKLSQVVQGCATCKKLWTNSTLGKVLECCAKFFKAEESFVNLCKVMQSGLKFSKLQRRTWGLSSTTRTVF